MKKILALLLIELLFFHTPPPAQAQTPTPVERGVKTRAEVGDFYLSLSGVVAPYAAISFIADGNVYKAITADSLGRFVFSDIRINRGFSNFCLNAVDWRRLGESYTCLRVDPATSDITMQDVFLPPTLGLSHKEIAEGAPVVISGYSLPNAEVEVYINGLKEVLGTADSSGYYTQERRSFRKGSYELYAGARYEGKNSLLPDKKIGLNVISVAQYYSNLLTNLIDWIMSHAYLFVIPSLLLLLLVVVTVVWWDKVSVFLHLRKVKLHHAWMIGY